MTITGAGTAVLAGAAQAWAQAQHALVERLGPAAPAGLADLAAALLHLDDRTAIVPGVSTRRPADVMRGEEVQLLGAVAAGLAPPDALLAQPGTHCKWARMTGGRITGFTTAMTGELFASLRHHGLLAPQLTGDVVNGPAFQAGVAEGRKRDLAASLFNIRAANLLNERADGDAASYASGLLIGSDVAARLVDADDVPIHIRAQPGRGGRTPRAGAAPPPPATILDSHAAFVAGIIAIGRQL